MYCVTIHEQSQYNRFIKSFIIEFLQWTLPSQNLDMPIVVNR